MHVSVGIAANSICACSRIMVCADGKDLFEQSILSHIFVTRVVLYELANIVESVSKHQTNAGLDTLTGTND
jgi:hypothetical protein